MTNANKINFTRVNNDVNGNPRMAVHFLQLLTKEELDSNLLPIGIKYDLALMRAKTVSGKKYHNKSYGGGIVFQEYESCLADTVNRAFESFEQSKVYTDAYNQLVLTVVNDRERYIKCFDLAKSMMKPLPSTRLGFTHILREVQETAEHIRKAHNVRTSKDAQFIAACMLCIEMERVIKARKL